MIVVGRRRLGVGSAGQRTRHHAGELDCNAGFARMSTMLNLRVIIPNTKENDDGDEK